MYSSFLRFISTRTLSHETFQLFTWYIDQMIKGCDQRPILISRTLLYRVLLNDTKVNLKKIKGKENSDLGSGLQTKQTYIGHLHAFHISSFHVKCSKTLTNANSFSISFSIQIRSTVRRFWYGETVSPLFKFRIRIMCEWFLSPIKNAKEKK